MPVDWKSKRMSAKVQDVLDNHDAGSSRCETAAKLIWELSVKKHATRVVLMLPLPEAGPVVPQKYKPPKGLKIPAHDATKQKRYPEWYYHAGVTLQEHCVCALATVNGHPRETYVETYFEYPDAVYLEELATPTELSARLFEAGL